MHKCVDVWINIIVSAEWSLASCKLPRAKRQGPGFFPLASGDALGGNPFGR